MRTVLIGICACFAAPWAGADEISVLTWNLESDRPEPPQHFADGNTPAVIAAELTALQHDHGPYDLLGLTEVLPDSASLYEQAANAGGRSYRAFTSTTGATDRLLILFDADRFELVGEPVNLESHDGITFPGGTSRRPFFVQLRDLRNGGLEFLFMVNHLTRGNAGARQMQAAGLREWAEDQTLPVIAAGDFNFDFDFEALTGNQSMAIFMEDDANQADIWKWIIPNALVETTPPGPDQRTFVAAHFADSNWADDNDSETERVDRFPGSILDFVFVAQGAREWTGRSSVIVREGDFPDTADTSDHRPVEARFDPSR